MGRRGNGRGASHHLHLSKPQKARNPQGADLTSLISSPPRTQRSGTSIRHRRHSPCTVLHCSLTTQQTSLRCLECAGNTEMSKMAPCEDSTSKRKGRQESQQLQSATQEMSCSATEARGGGPNRQRSEWGWEAPNRAPLS